PNFPTTRATSRHAFTSSTNVCTSNWSSVRKVGSIPPTPPSSWIRLPCRNEVRLEEAVFLSTTDCSLTVRNIFGREKMIRIWQTSAILVALLAGGGGTEFKEFSSPEGKFKALLPGIPKKQSQNVAGTTVYM